MLIDDNIVNELGDIILIKLTEPYKNITQINAYEDDLEGIDTENYFAKYFRWSIDNEVFSDFTKLTDENLQKLNLNPENDFWIEYKYEVIELNTGNILKFNSIGLEVITEEGLMVKEIQACVNSCNDSCASNLIIEECCDDEANFNPYAWADTAVDLYDNLSEVTKNIFGHCVQYYRAEPDLRSRDSVFKEDTLFNRNNVKELKVLVPRNEFPSNEIEFDPFLGMNRPEFEVHITSREFERIFGGGSRPRERDAMYIPINKGMYEISSVALSDEIHAMTSYWRVKLKKWEDKQNIKNSQEVEDNLDSLVTSMDDVFGEEVDNEMKKVSKPQQYKTIGTGENDHIRSEIIEDLKIVNEEINNNWTIVSNNYYDLSDISNLNIAVKYRSDVNITENDNRSFTFWFRPQFEAERPRLNIMNIGENNGLVKIQTQQEHGYKIGDTIELYNSGDLTGLYYIDDIIDDNTFTINTEYSTSYTVLGRSRYKHVANILYGYNINNSSQEGMSIEILRGYLRININTESYIFNTGINEYIKDMWYSTVINLSNDYNQITSFIYKLDKPLTFSNPQSQTTELELVYNEVLDLNNKVIINNNSNWMLIGSPIHITNIRIFNIPIEEESHDLTLNQYVVRDTQNNILADNAISQLKLMKLNNSR